MSTIVKTEMILKPIIGRLWVLDREMEYHWDEVTYIIPKNFVFDGASIPRFARLLIPKNGVKLYAACLHDYLYRHTLISRKGADIAFLRILLEMGEPKWSAYLMYGTLRTFGWWGWRSK
jgi:hypothetical protein